MKLVWCTQCKDVVNLIPDKWRRCDCGEAGGRYITNEVAEIFGPCVPFGISNASFVQALHYRVVFAGFVYGEEVPHNGTIHWVDPPLQEV